MPFTGTRHHLSLAKSHPPALILATAQGTAATRKTLNTCNHAHKRTNATDRTWPNTCQLTCDCTELSRKAVAIA